MILIIAEKPSLGRNIAAALGAGRRGEGCLSGNGYIVTWAFGHLFSLLDVEDYNPPPEGKKSWTLDNLPCFPETFRFGLRPGTTKKGTRSKRGADPGVKKQFEIIRELCRREDVEAIVNAGDADREGEIIVRLILTHALPKADKKPLYRLWLPDQTEQTIRAAAAAPEPAAKYDHLANEGYARTYADWLYGVNLTRYASIRTGKLLRVGRVIVPIVGAIYERDMAIRNFVPTPYFGVVSKEKTNGEVIELTSKKEFPAGEAGEADVRALCERYNRGVATVTGKKVKRETVKPGKLFSLSKLQSLLGKKYKMSMKRSLEVLQKLYEEGYVTYPRTNSEYLAEAEREKVSKIIDNVRGMGYPVVLKTGKHIFDDSKIESHSALTPTYKIPKKDRLTEEEMQVYSTIFRRFAAVFCAEDCIAEKTEMTVTLKENPEENLSGGNRTLETFTLRGTVILEPGWMKYDDAPQKTKVLPALSEGDTVNVCFKPVEKSTKPPEHYTIETLNNYLKNPFKEDKARLKRGERVEADGGIENVQNGADGAYGPEGPSESEGDDTEEYRAVFEGLELGTEATRTGIIDNARNSGYIQLKKDVYTILPDGEFLMESLANMQIVMDKYKTSTLGRSLKRVYRGEDTVEDCVALAKKEISEIFAKYGETTVTRVPYMGKSKKGSGTRGAADGEKQPVLRVGKCPLCGEDVVRGQTAYGCMGYKKGCNLRIGRQICGREIAPEEVYVLLESGQTPLLAGFTSKKGKPFSAYLAIDGGAAVFRFDSDKKDRGRAPTEGNPSDGGIPGDGDVPPPREMG